MESYFNLPNKVVFCSKCTLSNQRPHSISEFKHTKNREGAVYLKINNNGVCDACKMSEIKKSNIDWDKREKELAELCDRYRSKHPPRA